MKLEEMQNYIIFALVVAFFAWRFWKFKKVKAQMSNLITQGAVIVDVRSPSEFSAGANPISINIPLGEIDAKSKTLDKNKKIVVCCASGGRSAAAAGILKKNGFKEVINAGPWTNTLG